MTEYEKNKSELQRLKGIMLERGVSNELHVEGLGTVREYGELNVKGLVQRLLQSKYITG
jgi:hypothetical protein